MLRRRVWVVNEAQAEAAYWKCHLLLVPAGAIRYWQAWVYLAILTGASALTTLDLLRRDPALPARRMLLHPPPETRDLPDCGET